MKYFAKIFMSTALKKELKSMFPYHANFCLTGILFFSSNYNACWN